MQSVCVCDFLVRPFHSRVLRAILLFLSRERGNDPYTPSSMVSSKGIPLRFIPDTLGHSLPTAASTRKRVPPLEVCRSAVGQNQWNPTFGDWANSPPILEPILVVGLGCSLGLRFGFWPMASYRQPIDLSGRSCTTWPRTR